MNENFQKLILPAMMLLLGGGGTFVGTNANKNAQIEAARKEQARAFELEIRKKVQAEVTLEARLKDLENLTDQNRKDIWGVRNRLGMGDQ